MSKGNLAKVIPIRPVQTSEKTSTGSENEAIKSIQENITKLRGLHVRLRNILKDLEELFN